MVQAERGVNTVGIAILAGGLGTRMKSETPKALVALLENPLIFYAIESLIHAREFIGGGKKSNPEISIDKIGVVVGHKGHEVKDYIEREDRFRAKGLLIDFKVQEKYLGTGDAVETSLGMFDSYNGESDLLILPCDMPLILPETFAGLIKFHIENKSDLTVLSVEIDNPFSYGRVVRDENGFASRIVEEKELVDYPESIRKTNEINSGVYMVKLKHLRKLIKEIKSENRDREFYFTDIVNIFYKSGLKTRCFKSYSGDEFAGVNSKLELEKARGILQERIVCNLMDSGVTFVSTENLYLGYNVIIEPGATIYPGVFLSGKTIIMDGSVIENGCVVKDSEIMEGSTVKSYSVLENSTVLEKCCIGPFAHLRPGSLIRKNSKIGNFVEVKNSKVGENTKASHLSYIGDSDIGNNVNIGAGVITCNYDGEKKHKTVIRDGCFIGSDSQLVAPVTIGEGSYVASGTTVTKDVPPGALSVSRVPQKNIEGWAARSKAKKVKKAD